MLNALFSGIKEQLRGFCRCCVMSNSSFLLPFFLTPLSWVYGIGVSLRGWLYDVGVFSSYESSLPVVSIGNVTAGGNGKTPLCLLVAQELRARGFSPVILSRGYGGRTRGPKRVYHSDTPASVGDEAILMFQSSVAPVYVARRRADGAQVIERDQAGDVIVLDDGFQHRALARDVDIVSVNAGSEDAVAEFCAGRLLPLGRFRERRTKALSRADIVVISERAVSEDSSGEGIDGRLLAVLPSSVKVYRSTLEADGVRFIHSSKALSPTEVVAFAAIANPEGFFTSLERLGFAVRDRVQFRDHHAFTEEDLQKLLTRAGQLPLVCTAKDAVKVNRLTASVRSHVAALHVRAKVLPSDAFATQIARMVKSKR
jgi:tetraacyldisaccharide 4'-kinase